MQDVFLSDFWDKSLTSNGVCWFTNIQQFCEETFHLHWKALNVLGSKNNVDVHASLLPQWCTEWSFAKAWPRRFQCLKMYRWEAALVHRFIGVCTLLGDEERFRGYKQTTPETARTVAAILHLFLEKSKTAMWGKLVKQVPVSTLKDSNFWDCVATDAVACNSSIH